MSLKEKSKNLPSTPGVYLMKDSLGGIIYVGKSKNLKNRVQSYFQNSKAHTPKVEKLVKNIKDFEYILADTEFEAYMLECKLIKELKPSYNKLMKSPLSYAYIAIKTWGAFNILEIVNTLEEKDHTLYFGPYTNRNTVERAIQGIKEQFKINCINPSKKNTPCLNYSIGSCIGMCMGGVAAEQYNNIISKIAKLLKGTDRSILDEMEQSMLHAADKFDFETAAKYRDYIGAVNSLISREKIIDFTVENKNIVMVEKLDVRTIKIFLIKSNRILFCEKYNLERIESEKLRPLIKANILTYFMTKVLHPPVKVSRDEIDEAQIIYSYLKSSGCIYIVIPEAWLDYERNSNIEEEINNLLAYMEKHKKNKE